MVVTGDVEGQPVTLQVIVNNVRTGDSQALVAMSPPPGPDDGSSLSSYAGHVIIEPDGRSATISADLAHGGSQVVEHVEGGWRCATG